MSSELGQHFTPGWAAELLVEHYFPMLGRGDLVLEPTCGTGAFLAAVPTHVPAIGVEIDAALAAQARANTGREVICADIRTVQLRQQPTHLLGNPPFRSALVRDILGRAGDWLPEGGMVGMILSATMFKAASVVLGYGARWRVQADHLPQSLFGAIPHPLVFATFQKGGRTLVGFTLYDQAVDVQRLARDFKALLASPTPQPWRGVVDRALQDLGGEAELSALYAAIEPKRPTGNPWWREKVRQVAQLHFRRTGPARYALPVAAAA